MMLSNLNLSSLPECNFEVRYVDSVLLNPCAEYQRLLRMGKVARIAANFSEYIANEPKVSYRDGRYFVFDGQNTIEARKTCNDGRDLPIRCKVFYGLSKEHEALLFAVQTGISSELTAGEQLRAKLVAHEENACDFVSVTEDKCYTGYLINGNVEKECPELRIIEQEVFDRAQELRDTRRREKGEDSDSYSPHALLCGKVFCAHCGNRLNITSSGRTRLRADGSTVKEKRFRYSCHYNVRHPGQCDGQSGYGVTKLDAIVESIVCTKFSEILECSKSKLLQDMLRKDMEVAQKEVSRAKSELDLKDDERNALKDEMIRVIRGKSSIDRDMIQQLLDENQAAIQAAQDALTAAQNKLEEIEQENKKAENDCSNLFTWASTYQNASFQQRQTILNQFIKEVRVGRDYDIEIILNVPLEEFEEFKSHSLSVRTPSGRKTDLKQAPVRGLGTPNGGIVVFDKTSGEAMNIMPKSSAHVTLRCQDE